MDHDALRAMFHDSTSLAADFWERLPNGRAFTRPPDTMREAVRSEALPRKAIAPSETFAAIAETVMPFPPGPGHPRWWAFIAASAHQMGVATDLITSAVNSACFTGAHIATDYEELVIRWLGELCRFPEPGGGILVSGGSMANVVALAAAREAMASRGVDRRRGPVAVYCSTSAHFSVSKALRLLGFDASELCAVPADAAGRFDVDALRARMREDRTSGVRPLAVVATAGTAGTGVVDPIADLARVAEEAGCWFHVDAAYGGPAASLPEVEEMFAGAERADSLVVDPHKWLYVPYEAGAVLVRRREDPGAGVRERRPVHGIIDGHLLRRADALPGSGAAAVAVVPRPQGVGDNPLDRSGWVSRPLAEGPRGAAGGVSPRAAASAARGPVGRRPEHLIIRYVPATGDPDAFNRQLLDHLHRDGRVFLGPMTVAGRFGLRGCIVNFRSTLEDARICVEAIAELGERLERQGGAVR